MTEQKTPFIMNILNGAAMGTVIALTPGAMLNIFIGLLTPLFPFLTIITQATTLCNSLLGFAIGALVGLNFKMTQIQAISIGLASLFAGGAVKFSDTGMMLSGTGDIITMGITAALAVLLIQLLSNKTRAYAVLVIPTLTVALVGVVGRILLPYMTLITTYIAQGIASLLTLQPFLMCVLLAIIFSVLIVSPITTVGISLAISLSGIGAGAATLGICATGFGLAIAGWKVNSYGTSFAHIIGSPKISMANVMKKPIIILPMLCTSAFMGILAALFNIQGTKNSAGFGFAGFVGPVNALNLADDGWKLTNVLTIVAIFIVAPIILNIMFNYIFVHILKWFSPEDYRLNI